MSINVLDKILTDICLDERVQDGIFDIGNNVHMEVFREYLCKKGIPKNTVNEIVNLVVEKGKHPERQAWNKNGILVTFPTPEYKQRALQRGTHFEKNPKAGQTNLFGGGQTAPQAPTPVQTPTDSTPAIPPSSDTSSTLPPSDAVKGTGETLKSGDSVNVSKVEPQGAAVPEKPKTPQEVDAEKVAAKQMMNANDALPTVAGIGENRLNEELKKLTKIALEMNLNEAVRFLSRHF